MIIMSSPVKDDVVPGRLFRRKVRGFQVKLRDGCGGRGEERDRATARNVQIGRGIFCGIEKKDE